MAGFSVYRIYINLTPLKLLNPSHPVLPTVYCLFSHLIRLLATIILSFSHLNLYRVLKLFYFPIYSFLLYFFYSLPFLFYIVYYRYFILSIYIFLTDYPLFYKIIDVFKAPTLFLSLFYLFLSNPKYSRLKFFALSPFFL